MNRYSTVTLKNPREIVLLRGYPCVWGKCSFCDYIADNSTDAQEIISTNKKILKNVTGSYGVLEVINSGSVFELPMEILHHIKEIVKNKNIEKLFFEAHYSYRNRLDEIRNFFEIPIIFKCGIETFDDTFRNQVLQKGVLFTSVEEVASYFKSICIMVGIQGQTQEMIDRDIDLLTTHFAHGCINIFENNTTHIKKDDALITWFKEKYAYLQNDDRFELLFHITDFGVGDSSNV